MSLSDGGLAFIEPVARTLLSRRGDLLRSLTSRVYLSLSLYLSLTHTQTLALAAWLNASLFYSETKESPWLNQTPLTVVQAQATSSTFVDFRSTRHHTQVCYVLDYSYLLTVTILTAYFSAASWYNMMHRIDIVHRPSRALEGGPVCRIHVSVQFFNNCSVDV